MTENWLNKGKPCKGILKVSRARFDGKSEQENEK